MKKIAMSVSLFFVAGLLTAGMAMATGEKDKDKYDATSAQQQDQTQMQQDQPVFGQEQEQQDQQMMGATASAGQQQQIQAAADLKGAQIQNAQGEQLGEVSDLLIDVDKGQVGYAVVQAGGVLGMGEEKYIVPFKALKSGQGNTLVLDMQKDQMKQAPQGDVQQVLNRQKGQEIHQFYGVSPYWEESGQQMQQKPEQKQQDPMKQDQMKDKEKM